MKDIHSGMTALVAIAAAAYNADSAAPAIDLQGYDSAEIVLEVGVGGITFTTSNKIEFVLTHSDDNSNYSNVDDDDMIGVTGVTSGIIKSLVAAHAAAGVYRFGYKGNKRYLKLLADFSGSHGAATPLAACVLAGNAAVKPTANQA